LPPFPKGDRLTTSSFWIFNSINDAKKENPEEVFNKRKYKYRADGSSRE